MNKTFKKSYNYKLKSADVHDEGQTKKCVEVGYWIKYYADLISASKMPTICKYSKYLSLKMLVNKKWILVSKVIYILYTYKYIIYI